MPYSIRHRLLVYLLSLILAGWSAIAIVNYFHARNKIENIFDAHLIQSARVLLSLVDHELYEHDSTQGPRHADDRSKLSEIEQHLERHVYEKLLAFQISVSRDNFHFNSASAPSVPLSDSIEGLSNSVVDGIHWRVYTLHDPANIIVIRVAEPHSIRSSLEDEIALSLLIPLFVALPIIFVLIWKCVDIVFAPLHRIAADIHRRNPAQLEPVPMQEAPVEIQPLLESLNTLFGRLERLLESERRFTADAAHELRTPLTGLKTQTQIALRTQDSEKRAHALRNILKSVDRTTHLIEQLLALARLEPGIEKTNQQAFDFSRLLREIIADVRPSASDKNIAIEYDCENPVLIHGNTHAMSMLVRNLLDNAIHYTPDSGRVKLDLEQTPAGITLRIADNGPGIPQELREDVFKRFFRIHATQAPGSGLGLSIVKQIADLHHARINLGDSPEQGLQIDISFPHVTNGRLN